MVLALYSPYLPPLPSTRQCTACTFWMQMKNMITAAVDLFNCFLLGEDCEDTRPQNQLNAAKEQHKDLCNILQGAFVTLRIILLGVDGTIYYNTHTLKPFKGLGLDSQRVKKLASKLNGHSVKFPTKLVHTRRALSSIVINSHQEPVSGQACNPLDPH